MIREGFLSPLNTAGLCVHVLVSCGGCDETTRACAAGVAAGQVASASTTAKGRKAEGTESWHLNKSCDSCQHAVSQTAAELRVNARNWGFMLFTVKSSETLGCSFILQIFDRSDSCPHRRGRHMHRECYTPLYGFDGGAKYRRRTNSQSIQPLSDQVFNQLAHSLCNDV